MILGLSLSRFPRPESVPWANFFRYEKMRKIHDSSVNTYHVNGNLNGHCWYNSLCRPRNHQRVHYWSYVLGIHRIPGFTDWFPTQMAGNAGSVSMSWRHLSFNYYWCVYLKPVWPDLYLDLGTYNNCWVLNITFILTHCDEAKWTAFLQRHFQTLF